MQEFKFAAGGTKRGRNLGRIVGFREHVFTHDVSSVANFFSLQELNFVAATQRALDNPLHVSVVALLHPLIFVPYFVARMLNMGCP